jgi:hypothetical protein
MKFLFPILASVAIVLSQGFIRLQNSSSLATTTPVVETQTVPVELPVTSPTLESPIEIAPVVPTESISNAVLSANIQPSSTHAFGNPAGCASVVPADLTSEQMLTNTQSALGDSYSLAERRQLYIWNGPLGTYMSLKMPTFTNLYSMNFNIPLHIGLTRS